MDRATADALVNTLERDPSQIPACIVTLEDTIMRFLNRIAADPLAPDKLVFVGLEYRARMVLKRWQQLDQPGGCRFATRAARQQRSVN